MERRLFVLGLVVPVLAACATKTPAPGLASRYVQRGFASWYGHGDGYHGKLTASGERFDKNRLTAAHYDLPFGTRVRVRNLVNNRQVDLRINDRVPVETVNKGRILDVSYAAAKRLRMVGDGVVPVEITVRAWPRTQLSVAAHSEGPHSEEVKSPERLSSRLLGGTGPGVKRSYGRELCDALSPRLRRVTAIRHQLRPRRQVC